MFLDPARQNGLPPECLLWSFVLCSLCRSRASPGRPAEPLEKPDSVSLFSLLLFDEQLGGSWLFSAHRYERDVVYRHVLLLSVSSITVLLVVLLDYME